ncbi:hypothetical protein HELRODRAFT_63958 [Helobdella robusta]|uniref:PX domain-containing protein n=1 Tax=Helobdella robusta TaxID=6412 RepID=T1FXM8_HELRO|nr:hypothetical protein HELRODRAFT_63958 [Helobdella robusta]ESO06089.1 hypothetical protein HELRODRAFT_63958 [Helobdella robusta]
MAVFLKNTESYSPAKAIKIIRNEMAEDHTVYIIEINLGPFKWNVCKRYNEFYELNEKLLGQIPSLDRDLLPKKKIFGNNSESFVKKRQHQLEIYLQSLFRSFETLPAVLLKFLEFHKYEIHGIVEVLSEDFYEKGDQMLSSNNFSTLTTLQLNALCTRLQLPEPTCGSYNMKRDLGHLLDFVTRVKFLQVVLGHSLPFGTSNIIPNELSYHFQHFKSLESLKFSNCRMERVKIEDNVKKHLKQLYVCKTLSALKEILMSGVHWTEDCSEMPTQLLDACSWPNVTLANFNDNKIECIDDSIKLLPHLEQLSLVRNKLQEIEHLYHLSFLRSIDLSSNYISNLESLHIKLGNVTCLNLSRNRISTLSGFQKMYSLQKLNLSYNSLLQKEEIYHLRQLPNLEYLDTRKNPMAKSEGYRVDVYEMFGERAQDVFLFFYFLVFSFYLLIVAIFR